MYACAPLTSCVPMIAPKSSLGKQNIRRESNSMKEKILEAVIEMEWNGVESWEDCIKYYSPKELIDMWLRYEGIIGYSEEIMELFETFYYLIKKEG